MPNKDMEKGRERRFITRLRTCHGKRQSKHSAHLQLSSGYRPKLLFKQTKELEQGVKGMHC
jgi:hypothetical protein